MPIEISQWSRKKLAMCIDDVMDIVVVCVCLMNQSVIMHMHWMLEIVFGNDSSIIIAMKSRVLNAGKICNGSLRRFQPRFCAQLSHLATMM